MSEVDKFFASKLEAAGVSREFVEATDYEEDTEPFPLSVGEVRALTGAEDMMRIGRTIDAARRVADEFFYGQQGPKGLSERVGGRMTYIDDIFNSMMGWKKARLVWWLENVVARDVPEFESIAGNPVRLLDMDKPSEIEAFVRRGRGVKECWNCGTCGARKLPSLCARCKEARYCGVKCQKADWHLHKRYCTPRTEEDIRLLP
ncbi:hypothetical protein CTAYLR_008910 [Chrysophaeum taylorii]|uniref:MYND-type domain-containing protein n=1 Tax=Chrysophaeum taylorii TaxID=2483200 RepID=A0AAD7XHG8_9STRA|nr:hypothetical protein CTAYLR_008910 [Chrysophaeum taylorii]